jgi:5-methylcytosine-specific restriction endonuclease McrA
VSDEKQVGARMLRFRANPESLRKSNAHVDRLRKRRMAEIIAMKGGKCQECGYSRCTAALEFHHRVPADKLMTLNLTDMTKSWDRILVEVEKCDLLCANCHREHHACGFLAEEVVDAA